MRARHLDTLPAGDANHGAQFMLAGIIPMGAIFLESYVTMPWHVMIRFGKWDEILSEPMYMTEMFSQPQLLHNTMLVESHMLPKAWFQKLKQNKHYSRKHCKILH